MMDMDKETRKAIGFESDEIDNETEKKLTYPFYSKDEKWVQEYIEQFKTEPSFF